MLSNAFLRFLYAVSFFYLSFSRWAINNDENQFKIYHWITLTIFSVLFSIQFWSLVLILFNFCNKWFFLSIHNISTVINHSCICSQHKLHFKWSNKYIFKILGWISFWSSHEPVFNTVNKISTQKSVLKLI